MSNFQTILYEINRDIGSSYGILDLFSDTNMKWLSKVRSKIGLNNEEKVIKKLNNDKKTYSSDSTYLSECSTPSNLTPDYDSCNLTSIRTTDLLSITHKINKSEAMNNLDNSIKYIIEGSSSSGDGLSESCNRYNCGNFSSRIKCDKNNDLMRKNCSIHNADENNSIPLSSSCLRARSPGGSALGTPPRNPDVEPTISSDSPEKKRFVDEKTVRESLDPFSIFNAVSEFSNLSTNESDSAVDPNMELYNSARRFRENWKKMLEDRSKNEIG